MPDLLMGIDPGLRTAAVAIVERRVGKRYRYVASWSSSKLTDRFELPAQIMSMAVRHDPKRRIMEGVEYQGEPRRGLLELARYVGKIEAACDIDEVIRRSAVCRRLGLGRRNGDTRTPDARVKAAVERLCEGVPKRTNSHVRAAIAVAMAGGRRP